jgi:hypothetical protein
MAPSPPLWRTKKTIINGINGSKFI